MDFSGFFDLFVNLDQHMHTITQQYGVWIYALLALLIFCETGLVVMAWIPGDCRQWHESLAAGRLRVCCRRAG